MIYEMRTYEAMPGKLRALAARFADVTHPFFLKHGFRPVGYWTEAVGDNNNSTICSRGRTRPSAEPSGPPSATTRSAPAPSPNPKGTAYSSPRSRTASGSLRPSPRPYPSPTPRGAPLRERPASFGDDHILPAGLQVDPEAGLERGKFAQQFAFRSEGAVDGDEARDGQPRFTRGENLRPQHRWR